MRQWFLSSSSSSSDADADAGEQHTGKQQVEPTLCIIAQQLRQLEVFEEWLEAFLQVFRVWRMPEEWGTEGLKAGSGFVVHIGILRG